jgi:hypothetical protein
LFDEKSRGSKISWHGPFNKRNSVMIPQKRLPQYRDTVGIFVWSENLAKVFHR